MSAWKSVREENKKWKVSKQKVHIKASSSRGTVVLTFSQVNERKLIALLYSIHVFTQSLLNAFLLFSQISFIYLGFYHLSAFCLLVFLLFRKTKFNDASKRNRRNILNIFFFIDFSLLFFFFLLYQITHRLSAQNTSHLTFNLVNIFIL